MRQPLSQAEPDNRGNPAKQWQSLEISPETPLWADPMETATGRRHTPEDSEETTSLFEDRESFGHEGPLEDRPEDVDDDELTDHVQQYMRQLAKTPLLTRGGEKEVALRIEEAQRELEAIGVFAAQELLNIVSWSETVFDPGGGGKSDERSIATL